MDINCTHLCFYQHEGQCTLRELPSYTSNTYTPYTQNDTDCPYFAETYKVETPPHAVN